MAAWLTPLLRRDLVRADGVRRALGDHDWITVDALADTARRAFEDRSGWATLADETDRLTWFGRQLTDWRDRRDERVERLRAFARGLDTDGRVRLAERLRDHLAEGAASPGVGDDRAGDRHPTGPGGGVEDLVDRVLALVEGGPLLAGGWDGGASAAEHVGVLVLLAERLWRGEPTEHVVWAADALRGRFGDAVGPLGRDHDGDPITSSVRSGSVVFIGPPGSGKTTSTEPVLMAWPGPAITTTTKPADWGDGLIATLLRKGPVWLFDATGQCASPHPEVRRVTWSPMQSVDSWDSARQVGYVLARSSSKANVTDGEFWERWAAQVLAAFIHGARLDRRPIATVAEWVDDWDCAEVARALAHPDAAEAARIVGSLRGQDGRTLGAVMATAGDATDVFRSRSVQEVTGSPEFDLMRDLISCNGTVIMYADGLHANHTAPLYSLFVDAAIEARKRLSDRGWVGPHLMLALDEVANIVRLPSLPHVLTEGPGRGITAVMCLQDVQQALGRWGEDGRLFLTSSGHRVVFPGTTSPELHRWVLNLAGGGPSDRHGPPPADVLLDGDRPGIRGPLDVASPGDGRAVMVTPDARVVRTTQLRSYQDPEHVRAQREASALHHPGNAWVAG